MRVLEDIRTEVERSSRNEVCPVCQIARKQQTRRIYTTGHMNAYNDAEVVVKSAQERNRKFIFRHLFNIRNACVGLESSQRCPQHFVLFATFYPAQQVLKNRLLIF